MKFDVIGQRYKMVVTKYYFIYYSRRNVDPYCLMSQDISIFISLSTPLLEKFPKATIKYKEDLLNSNWKDIFEYAIFGLEPNWITFSSGKEYNLGLYSKEKVIDYLNIKEDEFEVIFKKSPYS
jgi:hypothetical protein